MVFFSGWNPGLWRDATTSHHPSPRHFIPSAFGPETACCACPQPFIYLPSAHAHAHATVRQSISRLLLRLSLFGLSSLPSLLRLVASPSPTPPLTRPASFFNAAPSRPLARAVQTFLPPTDSAYPLPVARWTLRPRRDSPCDIQHLRLTRANKLSSCSTPYASNIHIPTYILPLYSATALS